MAITTELVGKLGGYFLSVQPKLGVVYDLGRQSGDCLMHVMRVSSSNVQLQCGFDGGTAVNVGSPEKGQSRYGLGPHGTYGPSFRTIQFYGTMPWMIVITTRGNGDDYPYWTA